MTFVKNTQVDPVYLPCGGTAYFDEGGGGYGHRCECGAVVGSIGMPKQCRDEMIKWDTWAKLGGQEWDYFSKAE